MGVGGKKTPESGQLEEQLGEVAKVDKIPWKFISRGMEHTQGRERERATEKAAGQGGGKKPSGGREGGKEISGGGGEEEDGAATPGCAPAAAVGQGVSWLYDNVRWEPSSPPTPTLPLSFTHSHTHTFIAAVDGQDKPPWQVSAHTHGGWSMRWCGHTDVADGV